MNKITATGRLAADAEVRFTQGGDAIANVRLASDVGFGDKKATNWFTCTLFGKRAEALAPHLTKGLQCTVFGTLTLREWEKDGVKRMSPDIRIDEIELQGGGKQHGEQAAPARQPSRAPAASQSGGFPAMDEDIPFMQLTRAELLSI